MALLTKYYPWDLEPQGGADASNGPHLLYKVFRNPYAHALGTPDKTIGGMGTMAMTFPEAELEAMERSIVRLLGPVRNGAILAGTSRSHGASRHTSAGTR